MLPETENPTNLQRQAQPEMVDTNKLPKKYQGNGNIIYSSSKMFFTFSKKVKVAVSKKSKGIKKVQKMNQHRFRNENDVDESNLETSDDDGIDEYFEILS